MDSEESVTPTEQDGTGWALLNASAPPDLGDVDALVRFRRLPRLVRAEQRVAWRLGGLVLILGRFNQNAASVEHLHLLGWAIRSGRSRQILLAWWSGRRSLLSMTKHVDPSLSVTLSLAVVHGLARVQGSQHRRIALTPEGTQLAAQLEADEGLLRTEKDFLDRLGTLSDARVSRILGGGAA